MKTLYEITGIKKEGSRIRLDLKPYEVMKDKPNLNSLITDPSQLLDQLNAKVNSDPESITISIEEWEEHKWNVNDCIFVEILSEDFAKK